MKVGDLEFLVELDRLKKLADEASGVFDTTRLEAEFIRFSGTSSSTLEVKVPKLYVLNGPEFDHYKKALDTLGQTSKETVEKISITGDSDGSSKDSILIVSQKQALSDHINSINSYMNPILELIFTEGLPLIHGFTIHEALYGKVISEINGLRLSEAHLFPDRFKEGPYTLQVEFDTPNKSISEFTQFKENIAELVRKPDENMLNPEKIGALTSAGIKLRTRLGALARYEIPDKKRFSVNTNYTYLNLGNTELFYLYNEKTNTNAVVFFGNNIFNKKYPPRGLTILDGSDHELTLKELVALEYFEPSEAVLRDKIRVFEQLQESSTRASGEMIEKHQSSFIDFLTQLKKTNEYFSTTVNKEMRAQYIMQKAPELLEFMVCPKDNNPLLHALLPRLSWNSSIRGYHNTAEFKSRFDAATDAEKVEILRRTVSNIIFRNQQNNETNIYLAINHRNTCENAGIRIKYFQ